MKRFLIGMGALCIVFLLVSSATAVPQAYSKPLMNKIEEVEAAEAILGTDNLLLKDIGSKGLIDLLIQLITVIIQVIMEIISIVNSIITVFNLVNAVIEALQMLFDLINQLIEIINSIFNPSVA
jgi:hypothetical protein